MKPLVLAVLALVGVLSENQVHAQARWYVGPNIGGYGYGGFGGATTPESAAGMAMADMIRSQGMYNQMSSAAMINIEEARSKYIDNQRQWTEVYLMKSRALAEQKARNKDEARARNARYLEEQAANPSHLPPRLLSIQLNPSTGKINWPPALSRDAFVDQRNELDALFTTRAQKGTSSELSEAIYKKTREMHEELRKHIREIVPQEYMDARKFLDSLSLEGRYPTG